VDFSILIIIAEDADVPILLPSDLITEAVTEVMEAGILPSDPTTEDMEVDILLSDLIMVVAEAGILLSDLIMVVAEAIDAMEAGSPHLPSDPIAIVAMDVTHGKTKKTTVAATRKMTDLLQNSDQNPMRAKAHLIPPLTLPPTLKKS